MDGLAHGSDTEDLSLVTVNSDVNYMELVYKQMNDWSTKPPISCDLFICLCQREELHVSK